MSVIASSLRNLSNFLQDHQISFSNGLLVLFTVGGEQIFRFNAFACPCTQPEAQHYATIFMLAPAIILGIVGVVVSNLTWRVCHGCCHRSKGSEHGFLKASERITEVLARATVVPVAWLFVALLDGNYYACMISTRPCEIATPEYLQLKATSQTISWYFLLAVVLVSFIVIAIVRCCDSVTYTQYKYVSAYREAEQRQFDDITKKPRILPGTENRLDTRNKAMNNLIIKAHTEDLAKENVREFIKQPVLLKKDWDTISVASDHKISKQDDSSGPSFTPLHEWAKLQRVQNESREQTMVV